MKGQAYSFILARTGGRGGGAMLLRGTSDGRMQSLTIFYIFICMYIYIQCMEVCELPLGDAQDKKCDAGRSRGVGRCSVIWVAVMEIAG